MSNSLFTNKADCTGCRACVEVCPKKCISLIKDEECFLYPHVDESLCIGCHRCEKVCPQKNSEYSTIEEALVGIHSKDEVFKSASGGAFWAICEILIPRGYVVAGVKWTDSLNVVHDIAYTLEEAQAFRKSKYVLSNTNGVFSKVKALLKEGRKVMFTGTPCQVAACKKFIGKNDDLLLVDLVCHGAPNQEIFNKEITYLEQKHNGKLESFCFKQKKPVNGKINSRSANYIIDGKEYVVDRGSDPFLKGYYTRLFYRPSCGTCHFAKPERVSDITIGDAWGVEECYPEFDDLSGTSLLLFNSSKGIELKSELTAVMRLKPVDVQWAIEANQQLKVPTHMHNNRDKFFELFLNHPLDVAVKKCTHINLIRKMISKVVSSISKARKRV